MAEVAKIVRLIGSSPESFAKAADAAVQEAAKTLRGISGAHVVTMSAVVEGDHITEYRTPVHIAFASRLTRSGHGCLPRLHRMSASARECARRSRSSSATWSTRRSSAERLDAESLRGVLARYFEAMRAIVERHGGTSRSSSATR